MNRVVVTRHIGKGQHIRLRELSRHDKCIAGR